MSVDILFDTSAIGKHYHPEPGTAAVDQLLTTAGGRPHISRLTAVEVLSTFAKKVRVGQITQGDFRLLSGRFRADVRAKRFRLVRLTVDHFETAGRLVERLGLANGLRSLDALQLAVALDLNRPGRPVTFVSADQLLCALAAGEGLTVINPESA